ncbi:MAG TPA: hypothetical protein ENG69_05520 [Candidatus Korarchaeota archaeon]|nr:hypothetical protein [Candidatus Korarchaeota archaeon]
MWVQWILPEELAICGFPVNRKDMRDLRLHGVRAVVSLATGREILAYWGNILLFARAYLDNDIWPYFLPTDVRKAPSPEELMNALLWARRVALMGRPVAAHCLAGRGRSGTFVAAYLVFSRGMTANAAIERVRKMRPGAIESYEQEEAVRTIEAFAFATAMGDIPLSVALHPPREPSTFKKLARRLRASLHRASSRVLQKR